MVSKGSGKMPLTNDEKANRTILGRTVFLLVVCGFLIFIPLIAQLYKLQISEHEYWQQKALSQQTRGTTIEANRGTIYDRNYKTLAISASVESVYIAPKYIDSENYEEESRLIASGLSEILGIDYDTIYEKTQKKDSYYQSIARKLEADVIEKVRQFKTDNDLDAIQIEPDTKRYYTYGTFASQVLGFVNVDNDGIEGFEMYYDEKLAGTAGKIVSLKNAKGTSMFDTYEKYYDAEDGLSAVLTIDETIQHLLEKHLEQAVIDDYVENRGAAIVMEPKTGEILGMAVTGGSDLNSPRTLTEEEEASIAELEGEEYDKAKTAILLEKWRNKCVADTYEPGSIFKIITCSMALEEGVVTLDSTFTCTGSAKVAGWSKPISCWKKAGHGEQTLTRALQNSCNPAFISIGLKVGQEKFYEYLQAFGFGQKTGIDLPGEASGLLHDYNDFLSNDVSLAVASFGQTFTVTPIQLITAACAVVNGGYLMQPHIVKEFVDSNGVVQETVEPTVVRQVISEETSTTMRQLLQAVVDDGSGRNAQVAGYSIGGKTATSEKISATEDTTGKYVVSFLAVAPAEDPQIALLVLLDTPGEEIPQSQRSGGYLAAPLAGKILAEMLPYLGVEQSYTGEELFGSEVTMPGVTGWSVEDAEEVLNNKSMTYKVVGEGDVVTGQLPADGAKITTSSEVILYTEDDVPSDTVTVPNVVGMSPEEANRTIVNAGLYMSPSGALTEEVATVKATSQSLEYGTEVARGSVIDVEFKDSAVGDFAY